MSVNILPRARMLPFPRAQCAPRIAALLGTIALSGCSDTPSQLVCSEYAAAAITAYVQDSVSLMWLASGATLVVQDGAFLDSLTVPAGLADQNALPLSTPGSYERPGMYLVTVRRPGYADWVKASVVVRSGPCHVEGVVLTARLVPPA